MTTTTTTLIPTTSHEIHATANATKKTAATGTATPAEALTTMTPAAKTAGSVTETTTYRSVAPNVTD